MVYTETTRQGKQQPRQLESKIKKNTFIKLVEINQNFSIEIL